VAAGPPWKLAPPSLLIPLTSFLSSQVTPGLGILAALLVLFVMKEPVRGLNDGQRQSKKAVRGKDGFRAYLSDIWYLMKK
jgi:hypothetical protein